MSSGHGEGLAPSVWVARWLAHLAPGAEVLDVACGAGRHVRLAASLGMRVTAVDRDAEALHGLPASVERVAADLEGGPWPLAGRQFDAVVVTNYLHRPLFPLLRAALRSGAILVYETFGKGNARYGKPGNPDFLLEPDELRASAASGLHVLSYEDGFVRDPKAARVQRLAALRLPERGDDIARLLEQFAL